MPAPAVLLSIVCPVFNEDSVLRAHHKELTAALTSLEAGWRTEILYVDDGSPDQSLDVIKRLAAQDAGVCFVALSRHFGTEAALVAGIEHARGDVVVILDAKSGHPPQLIPALIKKWREGCEVVVADQDDGEHRGPLSRILSRGKRHAGPVPTDCCLLSRKAVHGLLHLRESTRSLPQAWLIGWDFLPATCLSSRKRPRLVIDRLYLPVRDCLPPRPCT